MLPQRANRNAHALPFGTVQYGDFDRLMPVSSKFGSDRGTPIDRYYIEAFLERHRSDIYGRVLEVGDDAYSRRFGQARVVRQDVLHLNGKRPKVTIVGDMTRNGVLPTDAFDCMIVTQTLHFIYDIGAAVRHMHMALRPGGVLLLTVPGISQINYWGQWSTYWSFSEASARRLFGDVFGHQMIEVGSYGNVFAATNFIQGIALEEVRAADLDVHDPNYPLTICVRATRASATV
jgi:SAM-dependent methyltransferase